ncbi:MAG: hypothetical protein HRU43_00035 [Simkaniaceae bacterium]|nr:hypothetical protein [Simkaniaceae bacterium]
MEFLNTHKKSLIIGVSSFVVGYVSGQIMQARSFEQQMAQNIFGQVTSQKERLRQSREGDEMRSIAAGQKQTARNVEALSNSMEVVQKRTRDLEMNLEALKGRFELIQKEHGVLYREHLKRKDPDSIFNKPDSLFNKTQKKD